ncbi:MarR family winged helix-turn-helix transcriptional regulator [Streptomyces clavifer]|uniref:MarR family winged helix-turn-helix transcriptional regulator n=1 Tax=Streptomyces clavifer TaxID=68188 RepID=UPI00309161AE|nr:MarR family winged helix-turn-helix transcriptional regulator [Streptomyces clavifer]WRY86442.1 MarR family winged helix-turn-helix transcriptional regulator [Streptomyces clavifer]
MSDPTSSELPNTAEAGQLSYAIFQLARAHRAHAAAMLRAMNLHPGQELLLMQLFDHDGRTQAELLERAGLDHSTVSKSLRRMQEAGLLTREPASHDRRVMVVHLTNAGRALQQPIADMWRTLEQVSVRDLTPDQIQAFTTCARIIEKSVRDHSRQSPGE